MDKEQIFEMAIRELTENSLKIKREKLSAEELEVYLEIENLSKQTEKILSELPDKKRNTIEAYIDKKDIAADKECAFLYVQGAKDIIKLLKELGVF